MERERKKKKIFQLADNIKFEGRYDLTNAATKIAKDGRTAQTDLPVG